MKSFLLTIVLVILSSQVYGFWSTGHMIISRIAYEELKHKNPQMLTDIENEILVLKQYSKEANHSFVESAVWADDNKDIEFGAFTMWHYVDTAYIMPDFQGEIEVEPMNVTWAIDQMKKTLNSSNTPSFNSDLALSFSWRYLIHLIGDLHQPLHASQMYSKIFPNGDMGGNLFNVTYPNNPQIKNLHALWDAWVDQYGSMYAPLNNSQWEENGQIAANITSQFPRSKVEARLNILNVKAWADESYELSKNTVYDSISINSTPTDEYIARGRRVVNEQLAVGGYRLADVMQKLHHKRYNSTIEQLVSF